MSAWRGGSIAWRPPQWTYRDLTALAGAPAAPSGICAYVFPARGTQHVNYITDDGHVHELTGDVNGWSDCDLTALAGTSALAPEGRAPGPAGYVFAAQGTQHVDYVGADGHIHELWSDSQGWHHKDLTATTGAPPVSDRSSPSAYMFDHQGTQHVDYIGADKHVHEFWWNHDGWHHHDLTSATGAPLAAAISPAGYIGVAGKTQHVVYVGTDGQIHMLRWANGTWHRDDIADGIPEASAASPAGYTFAAEGTQHVDYIGADGHIHELWWSGSWHHEDLSAATSSTGVSAGYLAAYAFEAQSTQHVVYTSASGRVEELWWNASGWHHHDLSTVTAAPLADFAPVAGYVFAPRGTRHVLYIDIGHLHIYELLWQPGAGPVVLPDP